MRRIVSKAIKTLNASLLTRLKQLHGSPEPCFLVAYRTLAPAFPPPLIQPALLQIDAQKSCSSCTGTAHNLENHAHHPWSVLQRLRCTVMGGLASLVACARTYLFITRRTHRLQHHFRQGRPRVALQICRRRVRRTRGLGLAEGGGRTAPVLPPDAQGPTERGGDARDVRRLPRLQNRRQPSRAA